MSSKPCPRNQAWRARRGEDREMSPRKRAWEINSGEPTSASRAQGTEPTEPRSETWTQRDVHGQTSLESQAWRAMPGQTSLSLVLLHPKASPLPAACAGPPARPVAVLGAVQNQQEHPSPSPAAAPGLGKAPVHLPQGKGWVGSRRDGWDAGGSNGSFAMGWAGLELRQLPPCPR